jgi:hypothetical protein
MDLYLDDCADANSLVRALQQAGHNVYTPRSEKTAGLSDPEHLAYAASHGYILITKNPADFDELHREWQGDGRAHGGILLIYQDNIRGKDMSPGDVARAIGNLAASGLPIEDEVHILNHWR